MYWLLSTKIKCMKLTAPIVLFTFMTVWLTSPSFKSCFATGNRSAQKTKNQTESKDFAKTLHVLWGVWTYLSPFAAFLTCIHKRTSQTNNKNNKNKKLFMSLICRNHGCWMLCSDSNLMERLKKISKSWKSMWHSCLWWVHVKLYVSKFMLCSVFGLKK